MLFELDEGPFSSETKALAAKELRETDENVKNALATLKKYIEEDTTLYFKTDDDFLLIFLRPCKFYPQSAFELMKRTAEFKQKNASLLDNLLPDDEKVALLEHNVVNVLRNRDHKDRRVLLVNVGKSWDPSKVSADQMFRLFYMIHQLALVEPKTQVHGTVVIMDFDGLSMKQVMGLTPASSMRLLSFIQDAMPLRLKEVHIVKQPFLFNVVWQMFKPFVREKLKKRMFFHGTKMSSLHAHMAPSHLPKNYDGDLPELNYRSADWYPTMLKYEDRVKEWNQFGYRDPELNVLDEDEFYQMFLRPCKWYASSAFTMMQRLYRFRENYKDQFKSLVPSMQKNIFTRGLIFSLPVRTHDGCRVLLIHCGRRWNTKEVNVNEFFQGWVMLLNAAVAESQTQINGVHCIYDMDGLSLSQVTSITPNFALMSIEYIQKCLPCRLKGIHIVNQSFLFNMIFAIFKPFLNEKLRKRIHFHGTNRESLYSFINMEALPTYYGGKLEISDEACGVNLWKYLCFFEEDYAASLSYGYTKKA